MINLQYGENTMIHRITYLISMLLLKEKQQRKLLRALLKTRKNIFQRFLNSSREVSLMMNETIDPVWAFSQGEIKTEEFRNEKQKIMKATEECRKAGIPEWMIKPLILDYRPPSPDKGATSQI